MEAEMKQIELIRAKLQEVVDETIGKTSVKNISVYEHDNHAGEPSIYVSVNMKSVKDIPDVSVQSNLSHRLVLAMESLDDDRFPYLYVHAPDEDPGVEPDLEYAEAFPGKVGRR
jgi:hypothetical protein